MSSKSEIEKLNEDKLVEFLRGTNPDLKDDVFDTFKYEQINGRAFLKLTKDDLKDMGLKSGPAIIIVEYIKELDRMYLQEQRVVTTL